MKFKKIIISIIIAILAITINGNSKVYAADEWVQKAFEAANSFLHETEVEDNLGGIITNLTEHIKEIIKAVNIALLVLLAALSTISLSIIGVRYILAGASPVNKERAKKSLHTVFIGMFYGFGAYVIWTLAMQIVTLIIGAFATS